MTADLGAKASRDRCSRDHETSQPRAGVHRATERSKQLPKLVNVQSSVGLLEAWWLWWQGVDVKPMSLHGLPMLWVGRIAKFATFVGGLTILLDLVGPERVRHLAGRTRRRYHTGTYQLRYVWIGGTLTILGAVCGFLLELFPPGRLIIMLCVLILAVMSLVVSIPLALAGVADILESERSERVLRWAGFGLLAVGFSFDLLTS